MKINVEFNNVEEMQDFAKLIGTPCNCNGVKVEMGAPTEQETKKEDNSKGNKNNTSKKAEKAKEEVKEKKNETPNAIKENESEKVQAEIVGVDNTSTEPSKDVAATEEPKVTKETIRAAFAKLIKAGKAKEAKDITAKYGANKVPDLKEEDYASVLKEVEALL
ncbi:hypothetical protein FDA33_17170 [Clostridium botulinum]|nr:hypothetical protein [Clostridium botulinum]NFI17993.1 hypothetical protein [Clostridium botulinum]NFL92779.1 hypothetical protein [Clostridium botulinum]NFN53319.1 hypothetical protein [Clostridium botulinum]NFO28107.1 hypothetical protein [Clostridium botulinum]